EHVILQHRTQDGISSLHDLGTSLFTELPNPKCSGISQFEVQQARLQLPQFRRLIAELIELYQCVSFVIGIDNRKTSVRPASAKRGHSASWNGCSRSGRRIPER